MGGWPPAITPIAMVRGAENQANPGARALCCNMQHHAGNVKDAMGPPIAPCWE